MLIYVRHSDDEVTDPTHRHDPKLTKEGKYLAFKKGRTLLKKYGTPKIIYCSPFRRTKQTLKYMLYKVSRDNIQIIFDSRVSRYFSEREKANPDIDGSTKVSNVPIYETRKDFATRAQNLTTDLNIHAKHDNEIVWCITHTSFYKKIAKIYNTTIPDFIPFMHYFIAPDIAREKIWCEDCKKYH